MDALTIHVENPLNSDLDLLFQRHHDHCHADTPPESIHMMDRSALTGEGITFVVLRDATQPIAMGAIKRLAGNDAELKSMHVLQEARGTGAAKRMLTALLDAARADGIGAVYLETGAQPSFKPARDFYLRAGFRECPPFGSYIADPNSIFMQIRLS